MAVIEFNAVSKVFSSPGGVPVVALRDVTFSLGSGCFAALVGVSGSGKTTLLNLASGMDTPTAGTVSIAGQDVSRLTTRQRSLFRRSQLGFVFQAYNLFPTLTVAENVEFVLLISGEARKKARTRAIECLDACGIADKAPFFPHSLSGGQQQRVAVARALSHEPKIILADEPTANLDYETGQQLIHLFRRLNKETAVSFLFSSHDQELIKSVDRVLRIQSGQLLAAQV